MCIVHVTWNRRWINTLRQCLGAYDMDSVVWCVHISWLACDHPAAGLVPLPPHCYLCQPARIAVVLMCQISIPAATARPPNYLSPLPIHSVLVEGAIEHNGLHLPFQQLSLLFIHSKAIVTPVKAVFEPDSMDLKQGRVSTCYLKRSSILHNCLSIQRSGSRG